MSLVDTRGGWDHVFVHVHVRTLLLFFANSLRAHFCIQCLLVIQCLLII